MCVVERLSNQSLVRRKRSKDIGLMSFLAGPSPHPRLISIPTQFLPSEAAHPGSWLHKSQVLGGFQPTMTLASYSPLTWTRNGSDSLLLIFRSVFEGQEKALCPRIFEDLSPEIKAHQLWYEYISLIYTKHHKLYRALSRYLFWSLQQACEAKCSSTLKKLWHYLPQVVPIK